MWNNSQLEGLEHLHYGTIPLFLGIFDRLGLDSVLSAIPNKTAHNAGPSHADIIKSLIFQLCDTNYKAMWGTSQFYSKLPVKLMFPSIAGHEELNRFNIARTLDALYEYGPERLFANIAKQAFDKLGVKPKAIHIDTTSFHTDSKRKEDETTSFAQPALGYSRDHRPDLQQYVHLHAVDDELGIPMFAKSYSGNVSDKDSFLDFSSNHAKHLKRIFETLSILVGDSALCTQKIFNAAQENGLDIVTRVPDSFKVAKECFEISDSAELTPINVKVNRRDQYHCCWVKGKTLFDVPVTLLVLRNDSLRPKKEATTRKKAKKEQEAIEKALAKLSKNKPKCKPDAERELECIRQMQKFTKLENIQLAEVQGYAKSGRPRKNQPKETIAIDISADVEINEEAIESEVNKDCKFVIATTDVKRKWSMESLHDIYSRQSLVESNWKTAKNPDFTFSAFYVQKPSRATALLWLLSVAILLMAATEAIINKELTGKKIPFKQPDNSIRERKTTYGKVHALFRDSRLIIYKHGNSTKLSSVPPDLDKIIRALGNYWSKYFDDEFIASRLIHH